MKKIEACKMSLSTCEIILFGDLAEGDVDFIHEWLLRIEAAQQKRAADRPISPEDEAELENMPLDPDEKQQGGG